MKTQFSKWLPAIVIMLVIFWFSAQPGSEMPTFNWADTIIKKGGHVIGYALLASLYWRALDFNHNKRWVAWFLAVLYALTDEFHQSFVPGRSPSVWDVMIFDNVGAVVSLWLISHYRKEKRPDEWSPAVETTEC
jgi:VanZ family protein